MMCACVLLPEEKRERRKKRRRWFGQPVVKKKEEDRRASEKRGKRDPLKNYDGEGGCGPDADYGERKRQKGRRERERTEGRRDCRALGMGCVGRMVEA